MTKAFPSLPRAGIALLCLTVSGAPLPAAADPETVGSFEITSLEGATIDFDIVGSGGNPAVYTYQPSIDLLFNSARISSEAAASASGVVLSNETSTVTVNSFLNAGVITAANGGFAYAGVNAENASFDRFTNTKDGKIAGDDFGVRLVRTNVGSFANSGEIRSGTVSSSATALLLQSTSSGELIFGTLSNDADGEIVGGQRGVHLDSVQLASVFNAGRIEATNASGIGLEIANSTIESLHNAVGASIQGGGTGLYINSSRITSLVNDGVIEGEIGIAYRSDNDAGATIVSSGTIIGRSGIAIDFDVDGSGIARNDTLILAGHAIVNGEILFASGYDTLDVSGLTGGADLRVSNLEDLIEGDRIVLWDPDTRVVVDEIIAPPVPNPSGPPTTPDPPIPSPPANRIVIVDPATIAPDGVAQSAAGVVQGIAGLIGSQATSAGYAGSLMSPAAAAGGSAVLTALDIGDGERPRVWGDIFGYSSNGPSPAQLSGLAIGADTRFGDAFSAGVLLSASQSGARFSGGADALESRTAVTGFYGTYHAGVLDVGFSLLGGLQVHESSRRIATAGGVETAHGSFGGVFAAPGASAAVPLMDVAGTAIGLRASATYVVGVTSGYTETGSSSNLTIGPRPVTSLDTRLGLEARHAIIAGSVVGEGVVRAGVFGLVNGGGANVPVTLFGQTIDVATTPSAVYGVYAGTGLAAGLGETVRFELNADTALRTDTSLSLSLRGGLSGTF